MVGRKVVRLLLAAASLCAVATAAAQAYASDGELGVLAVTSGATGGRAGGQWSMGTGSTYDTSATPDQPPNLRPWTGGYYNLPASPYYGSSYFTIHSVTSNTLYVNAAGPTYNEVPPGSTKVPLTTPEAYQGTVTDGPSALRSQWQTGVKATNVPPVGRDDLLIVEHASVETAATVGSYVHHTLEVCALSKATDIRVRVQHMVRPDALDDASYSLLDTWGGETPPSREPGDMVLEDALGLRFLHPATPVGFYMPLRTPELVALPAPVTVADRVAIGEYNSLSPWGVQPRYDGLDEIQQLGLYLFWGLEQPIRLQPGAPEQAAGCAQIHSYFGPRPLLGPFWPEPEFGVLADGCGADTTFHFWGAGQDTYGIEDWTWDLGDGDTRQGPWVSHRYDAHGTHTVTLTVLNQGGVMRSITHDVKSPICPPPPPPPAPSPPPALAPPPPFPPSGPALLPATVPDEDRDGVQDGADNCPAYSNRDQEDSDGDGQGDACDEAPSIRPIGGLPGAPKAATSGACPPDRNDKDGDGLADACDADRDGDGVPEAVGAGWPDNCPNASNPEQRDVDRDGAGDACDPDDRTALLSDRFTRPGERRGAEAELDPLARGTLGFLAALPILAPIAVSVVRGRRGTQAPSPGQRP